MEEPLMSATTATPKSPLVIKKYPNRRLYNTETSAYITLDDLHQMVVEGRDFVVLDARTKEDLTRVTLTQIIFEMETNRGHNLLPLGFLRQVITFYGDNLGQLVPGYLDQAMSSFTQNQETMREYQSELLKNAQNAFDDYNPLRMLEQIGTQQMQFFEQAMQVFQPTEKSPRPKRKKG
jgi:polyhydroxyalkanoate synthesis repressor PhaR